MVVNGWYEQRLDEEGTVEENGSMKSRGWLNATARDLFISQCLLNKPFAAIIAQYDPPYKICQRIIVTTDPTENDNPTLLDRTEYYPDDHAYAQQDAEFLPFLMSLSTEGNKHPLFFKYLE